jgi:hypothetical protein
VVASSLFDIDSLKIQEESESLTLLSGSEGNSIINIKSSMLTDLILEQQLKVKEAGLREKGLAQTQYLL